jgi:hypothetical protein
MRPKLRDDHDGCFEEATVEIEVNAGQGASLPLSLCKICVNKFFGDD